MNQQASHRDGAIKMLTHNLPSCSPEKISVGVLDLGMNVLWVLRTDMPCSIHFVLAFMMYADGRLTVNWVLMWETFRFNLQLLSREVLTAK